MTDSQVVDAAARAGMGTFYLIAASNESSLWGMLKEVFAMRSAATDIPDGPLSKELKEAGRRLAEGKTGVESVDSKEKGKLRTVGKSEIKAILPLLETLDTDSRNQINGWLVNVAKRTASAAKDKGGDQKVTEAEQAAIEELTATLGTR